MICTKSNNPLDWARFITQRSKIMLIRLKNVNLRFGTTALLDDAAITLPEKNRLGLVGRNGVGKTTFLKLLNGDIHPDSGEIEYNRNIKISYLPQSIPEIHRSVRELIAKPIQNSHESWQVTAMVDKLLAQMDLDGQADFMTLSGGFKRRVLLAQALISEPSLLILDEPTNHLDLPAITWLENYLLKLNAAVLFVSHDRQFIRSLAEQILDLDRGKLTLWDCGYDAFLQRKADWLHAQELEWQRFDKKLAEEEIWIRQGIKARRTRNEGRVRALKQLRLDRAKRRTQQGTAKLQIERSKQSGKIVLEASHLNYRTLINDFSITIQRGDKIGILGANGCGKSTLINLLLKNLAPDSGQIEHGTQLEIAYFDQLRAQIHDEQTVVDNVSEGRSHITLPDKSVHIMRYLQDFLFSPEVARMKASALSGGERNRLLLAKLFSKPANLLILDEPSNDLDIETLELLEELLDAFTGTVLLVSHDREFLNNVVTSTLAFTGPGKVEEFVGGYDDYVRQMALAPQTRLPTNQTKAVSNKPFEQKLNNRESNELKKLPDKIMALETEIAAVQQQLADPKLFTDHQAQVIALTEQLRTLEATLSQVFTRWEELEAKK